LNGFRSRPELNGKEGIVLSLSILEGMKNDGTETPMKAVLEDGHYVVEIYSPDDTFEKVGPGLTEYGAKN
jgi:hypothetical protein